MLGWVLLASAFNVRKLKQRQFGLVRNIWRFDQGLLPGQCLIVSLELSFNTSHKHAFTYSKLQGVSTILDLKICTIQRPVDTI